MKVAIYGASVTAQKGKTGYFECLQEMVDQSVDLVRLPFGASHLHFAGLAMIKKVIDEKPDICILDWVTPSTKEFPEGIVDRINAILLANAIFPIWVLLPRTDDAQSDRKCCRQILATKSEFVKVFNFQSSEYKESDLSLFLRDVVHTNAIGAEKYANFINDIINGSCQEVDYEADIPQKDVSVPTIVSCEGIISRSKSLNIAINVLEDCNLSLYCLAKIGPSSPVLEVRLVSSDSVVQSYSRNVVDPWCYYERIMLLNFPSMKKVIKGIYNLEIKSKPVDPFETVETLKPIPSDSQICSDLDRFLDVSEFVIDGFVEVERYNYGV